MRPRFLELLFAGICLVLAAGWYFSRSPHAPAQPAKASATNAANSERLRIVPVYRKQFFSWREIESTNYDVYIRNLRAVGCPEQTIRDIIVCDVDAMYSKMRLFLDVPDPDQQWWRSNDYGIYNKAFNEKRDALDNDRKSLLTRLLGPDWILTELVFRYHAPTPMLQLDGPVLGALSNETKEAIYDLMDEFRSQSRAHRGLAILAQDEKILRAKLAGLLTPPQLEEFLLRYSSHAEALRSELGELKFFNSAPDEFRSLFRATDAIDLQISSIENNDDPAVQQQKQALEQQREDAIKAAIGPQRYAEYLHLQDPAYQAAMEQALAAGNTNLVQTLYSINQAVVAEQWRIDANTNLTDLQKQIEMKKAELAQLQAQAQAQGDIAAAEPPAPPMPQPVATVTTQAHVIQPGENLGSLARTSFTRISDIITMNPGVDFHNLKPGDTINLPVIQPNPATQ